MNAWARSLSLGAICVTLAACSVAPSAGQFQMPFGAVTSRDFAAEARQTGQRYANESVAQQDGFAAINAARESGVVLYRNSSAVSDSFVADAAHPEGLLYGHVQGQSFLLGLLYLAPTGSGPSIPGATWTRLDTLVANQRLVPVGVPDAVSSLLTSYDAVVVWMFDHPGGQFSTTVDRSVLEAALRYGAPSLKNTDAPASGLPSTSAPKPATTPQANPKGVQNARSVVGVVTSVSRNALTVSVGNTSRTFTIGPNAGVTIWGTPSTSGALSDIKVGDRVSVGTPSAKRPDLASTIVILQRA